MPRSPAAAIPPEKRELIAQWLACGAPNN